MRHKWKRLLLTTMAVGMLSSVTAFAANVSMNLFYNGKNHAYNAKEIVVKIDGKTMTPKDMPAVAIDGRTLLPMRQIAQELGCEVKYFESKTDADYAPNLETAVDEGYDLILCIGFLMADTLKEVAANYPDQTFAIVDNSSVGDNVIGVNFATEQCSYLVGVAAATMTKTNNVGFVIGMVSPVMNTFGYGFYAGVRDTNPDCQIQCYNANSFGDAAGGKAATINMYTNGADVVYHAAGATGLGVIEAGKEQGKLVIGVDQDQSSLAPEAVLTSAVKRVDNGVFALCKDGVEGTLKPGSDVNYDITSGAVDVAPTDTLMSDECKAAVAAAKEKILSGEIKVPATTEAFDAAYGSDYYTLDD